MKNVKNVFMVFCLLAAASALSGQNRIPQAGEKFPVLSFETADKSVVKIQDFKGKYVFVDVWASWCAACLAAKPYIQTLEKELAGRNIVFVSISIDAESKAWEKAIETRNTSGVLLRSEPNGAFVKVFDIRAVPRFMLIDRDGFIVNPTMSHPISKATLEILKRLEGM